MLRTLLLSRSEARSLKASEAAGGAVTLEDLGNIGEFVGAIGVVASLIYLALQIRQNSHLISQNTSAVKVASADSYLQYGASLRSQFIQDPEVVRIWMGGVNDPESLKAEDRMRFSYLMLNAFYAIQNTFLHTREGVVDREFWEADEAALRAHLQSPGVRAWWPEAQTFLTGTFAKHVNSLLEEILRSESKGSADSEPAA